MTHPYCFDIETLLNDCQPASILVMGSGAQTAVRAYREQKELLGKGCHVDHVEPPAASDTLGRRYDMGVVTETLEFLDKRRALVLLSRLRDLYTSRFCVAVRIGAAWPGLTSYWHRRELLGAGMLLVNSYDATEQCRLQLYKYDIASYKPTPGWLNPDDWANPELWNKYRW